MINTQLLCVILLFLPLHQGKFLTATRNENSISQLELLMEDAYHCIKQECHAASLRVFIKTFRTCLLEHNKHCNTRGYTLLRNLTSTNTHPYCTHIVLENNYHDTSPMIIHSHFLSGYIILVDFVIFDFEWQENDGMHGLLINHQKYNGINSSIFFNGKRLPWTTLIDNNKVTILIKTVLYRKYKLNLFYSSYKLFWLFRIHQVDSMAVSGKTHIKTHSLSAVQPRYKIERFQYTVLALGLNQLKLFILATQSNTKLTVYDGPGHLANILFQMNCIRKCVDQHVTTSTFSAYIQIDFMSLDQFDNITIHVEKFENTVYPICRHGSNKHIYTQFSENQNSICRIYIRGSKASVALRVNTFIFDGARTAISEQRQSNCQYGGIYYFSGIPHFKRSATLRICETRSYFTLASKGPIFDGLVVWFKGYSKGSLSAYAISSKCIQYELELFGNPTVTSQRIVTVDDTTECLGYICPPLQTSYQTFCKILLRSSGGSLGIIKLIISQSDTINTCIPEYSSEKNDQLIQVQGIEINNWPLGKKETFHIFRKIKEPVIFNFKYLLSVDILSSFVCSQFDKRKQTMIMFITSTCKIIKKDGISVTSPINNIHALKPDCYSSSYTFNSQLNELLFKEAKGKFYKGFFVESSYHPDCPQQCRRHTIIMRVWHRMSNRVYEYVTNIGEEIQTVLYHNGLHMKIIGPEYPCNFIDACSNVEVAFDEYDLDYKLHSDFTWRYNAKDYQYFKRR